MKKTSLIIKNILITLCVPSICFLCCLVIWEMLKESALIPSIFVLAVLIVSVATQGYIYGIIASVISVFAVNFAFTFPYFAFDFTIAENIISAIILIIVTLIACALTTQIKYQENIKLESEKERMRANLLRAVSHDLRTPLATIYGSGTALLESYDLFTEEQRKRMLVGIREDAQWLTSMVENLLSVTRLDGGRVDIIKTETALDELIDSVLIKFKNRYPYCTVEAELPEELVIIPMDAMLIEQVLLNILENAAQHAKGMTKIKVNVVCVSDKAIFEISDNGCGIPKDRLKRIFQADYISDSVPSDSKKTNAGIGLSVCASIIKAHGGSISAHNLKKGGAVFKFVLNMEE